jgi:hypothetical protein
VNEDDIAIRGCYLLRMFVGGEEEWAASLFKWPTVITTMKLLAKEHEGRGQLHFAIFDYAKQVWLRADETELPATSNGMLPVNVRINVGNTGI